MNGDWQNKTILMNLLFYDTKKTIDERDQDESILKKKSILINKMNSRI